MDIQEILRQLEYYDGALPRKALDEAIASKERITPALLKIIEESTSRMEELLKKKGYLAHIYAFYLLAQFREKRAYPLIINFFSKPGRISLDVAGDFVTEDLARVLASVCSGDFSHIEQLTENEAANEYVRCAALKSQVCLVVSGQRPREEVLTYYKGLFNSDPKKQPSFFWTELVSCCTYLYPEEVYPEIKKTFEEGLIDEFFINPEDVDRTMAKGRRKVLADLQLKSLRLIEDTIKEIEWWACFKPKPQERALKRRKIGRNDPCPCGSGKKYKKCCGV